VNVLNSRQHVHKIVKEFVSTQRKKR